MKPIKRQGSVKSPCRLRTKVIEIKTVRWLPLLREILFLYMIKLTTKEKRKNCVTGSQGLILSLNKEQMKTFFGWNVVIERSYS